MAPPPEGSGWVLRRSFPSDIAALPAVMEWLSEGLRSRLSGALVLEAEIAVTEIFSNIARHGHAHLPPDTPIAIAVTWSEAALLIEAHSHDVRFDVSEELEERRRLMRSSDYSPLEHERHWGLRILANLVDQRGWSIESCLPDPGTRLIRLRKPSPAGAGPA
ncbi:ATP-binding protein [Synechococcus sp. RSCCF101]|uniref:ATP-binding protein n=1 Tax=Synechococcus sp. RSCCF101 TaxID=2511069 RepID=UPI0012469080|nr:ATP-binding protein [Synechococcus sp. RSCCF101]QEY31481.1 ATP-binding protein [Synechococcus sp. RSCCF101]